MKSINKLGLIFVLFGSVGLIGCSDEETYIPGSSGTTENPICFRPDGVDQDVSVGECCLSMQDCTDPEHFKYTLQYCNKNYGSSFEPTLCRKSTLVDPNCKLLPFTYSNCLDSNELFDIYCCE